MRTGITIIISREKQHYQHWLNHPTHSSIVIVAMVSIMRLL